MVEDAFVRWVERRRWTLMGVALLSALALSLLGLHDLTYPELLEAEGFRFGALLLSGSALLSCTTVMLLAVTAEGRRMRAFHKSLDWTRVPELADVVKPKERGQAGAAESTRGSK